VYDAHNFTSSYAAAAGQSINAGVDLDCGATYSMYLGQAVNESLTSEIAVRQAATRLYATLVRLGYFDPASTQPLRSLGWSAVNTPAAQDLTYRAAWESAVLLKNDGLLPLSTSKYRSVALVGPWANNTGLGGIYSGQSAFASTVLQGMTSTFKTVHYQLGTNISSNDTSAFAAALSAARGADLVVYAGGIDPSIEMEANDRTNITWPGNQLSLIEQLAAVGKPMVVLQFGGGQVDDSELKANKKVGAILWAGYPGQSGGRAVADVLSGKQAPAGRLTITQYPASYADAVEVINMNLRPGPANPGRTYKWYTGTPVYDFGHGLHYTTFSAKLGGDAGKSFSVQKAIAAGNSTTLDNSVLATVTAAVKNTGKVTSDYVAALYVSSTNGPAPHPKRALVAFQRLHGIQPGKTATASLALTLGAMSRIETNGDMNLYPGKYTLTLDNPDQQLAHTTITLTGSRGTVEAWNIGNGTQV
jgi:beta-D-xylosidase 4